MDIAVILLILSALVFIVTTATIEIRKARNKVRDRIIQSWGKPPEGKYEPGDLDSIASYHRNREKNDASRFTVDDITWQDLDMDDLFARLNGTLTTSNSRISWMPASGTCIFRNLSRRTESFSTIRFMKAGPPAGMPSSSCG